MNTFNIIREGKIHIVCLVNGHKLCDAHCKSEGCNGMNAHCSDCGAFFGYKGEGPYVVFRANGYEGNPIV